MKPQPIDIFSSQSKLAMHRDSHTISKCKPPKIRIIHIFAPKIINTDVEHFRELVQRLTGKPTEEKGKTKKSSSSVPPKDMINIQCPKPRKNVEYQDDQIQMMQNKQKMKKEAEEIYGMENSNSYLHSFGDMDCFNIQDMIDFPILPFKSSQMNTYGEMPLC